jgi:creatinine amidohydrolase/Fe(II)-dependent formamide hydrolase-like protein
MPTEQLPGHGQGDDPLALLEVIDRLEVCPVELREDRLTMPYRVVQAGKEAATELIYRFEEPVFDPEEEASRNLGSLIGAQVALNYGLFCGEIVLNGSFDPVDRAFLREMAANTAREIYVKKFLEPNPFLEGPAAGMPVVRWRSYLRAELRFPEPEVTETSSRRDSHVDWPQEPSRIAVLSSGGKDSLLSYGLLDELGLETHSVFVNESGRHWHTALNGYRHLSATRPTTTTRVWTSADRVFTWMLRRLPFVRKDFARLRSDEYPIRLWTVAVFLFGALPVLRCRGVARLVIGDEHDTSHRTTHKGITHYDGLYDQSRYFDEALSRYFRRKGWPLTQFSILRQLSELLVQKTLVERYPELQRHQLSCHATHLDGERALPCGNCEKCRPIVGMLLALDAEPGACGYTEEQVRGCIESLATHGVHQEIVAVQQLGWMLAGKGFIAERTPGMGRAQERREVLDLRFAREASPPDCVPLDLRKGLFSILLQHAAGAVRKAGRSWVPFDALSDPCAVVPHRHDPGRRRERSGKISETGESITVLWGQHTWIQAKERLQTIDTALLPVGAIEQHGPHLPLDTDAWDAEYICRRVAERCTDPKPLVLPLIPCGVSYHHDDFSGTISVGPDVLAAFVYDVGMSVARHGIAKLVIINGHGGNAPTLQLAAQKINRDARIFTCVDSGETSDTDVAALAETPNDVHAGEIETSTTLATRPELVDRVRAEASVPEFSSQYLDFTSKRSVPWYEHTARLSESGVLGDPSRASAEKGERIWQVTIDHLVRLVETLKTLSLEEIYARRH